MNITISPLRALEIARSLGAYSGTSDLDRLIRTRKYKGLINPNDSPNILGRILEIAKTEKIAKFILTLSSLRKKSKANCRANKNPRIGRITLRNV